MNHWRKKKEENDKYYSFLIDVFMVPLIAPVSGYIIRLFSTLESFCSAIFILLSFILFLLSYLKYDR